MKQVTILRRRKLGRTSCREIANNSVNNVTVQRSDLKDKAAHADYVVRWGCTANLPAYAREATVINSAKAIHRVNDKLGFRKILNEHELCPETWFGCDDEGFYEDVYNEVGPSDQRFDVVVRPSRHAQGRNLHVCSDYKEVQAACYPYGEGNYYISRLIDKVAEYRVFVVQGRVACVAQKTPGNPDDVAWNVAKGGRFDNVRWSDWDISVLAVAIRAFNLSGLDFGGVDVMVDAEGRAYVLEINSAPSLTSPYRQECMAKCLDYIVEHGKGTLKPGYKYNRDKYYNYIHPAITEKAAPGELVEEAA